MVRSLQPGILINDRLDLMETADGWDYHTPEQVVVQDRVKFNGQPVLWETCQTFSGSWGYHRDESSWKSVDQLLRILIDSVCYGGNLLLNVGPTARGEFDDRALERLGGMGEWMRRHGRAIYGCTQAPKEFRVPENCRLTYNPASNRLYVHLYAWPYSELHLPGFAGKVEYAQLLNDASELPMIVREAWQDAFEDKQADTLILKLPVQQPNVVVPVIELFLK